MPSRGACLVAVVVATATVAVACGPESNLVLETGGADGTAAGAGGTTGGTHSA
jgi:hypothetical protein